MKIIETAIKVQIINLNEQIIINITLQKRNEKKNKENGTQNNN